MNFARIRLFSDRTIVFYYQPDLKTSFPSVFDNDEAVELVRFSSYLSHSEILGAAMTLF